MRLVFLLATILFGSVVFAQDQRKIQINLDKNSKFFDNRFRSTADSAFKIANAIFNSSEFKVEIAKADFSCESICSGCLEDRRISGIEVLNTLFREPKVTIILDLREKGGPLGETSKGSYYTKAWYKSIIEDMPEFKSNFAYGLAVNLCHEYMHQVGYCHTYCTGVWPSCSKKYRLSEVNGNPDPRFLKDDVTCKVGWTAYYILKKWADNGVRIQFDNSDL